MSNIAILYHGPSSEAEVSDSSMLLFSDLLKNFNPQIIEWNVDFSFKVDGKKLDLEFLLNYLKKGSYIVVNALHGEYGEDGWIQERLEEEGISFTGPSSKSARLAMNKYESADRVRGIVKIIPAYRFKLNEFSEDKLEGFNFPVFIKPNAKGSSVNTYKIQNKPELLEKIKQLPKDEYLIQSAVSGIEVSVGVVKNKKGFYDIPMTEIVPLNDFFDYEAKYKGQSKEITPANLSVDLTNKIQAVAREIHNTLDLGFYSRTDFIIDNNNNFWYLETNSLPGMSAQSILPQQLRYANMLDNFAKDLIVNFS